MEKHSRLLYALLEIKQNEEIDYKISQEIIKAIKNKEKSINMKEIAKKSFISFSTLHRFCKRLNMTGIKELKTNIELEIKHQQSKEVVENLDENNSDLMRIQKMYETLVQSVWMKNELSTKKLATKYKKSNATISILTTTNYYKYAEILDNLLVDKGCYVNIFNEEESWEKSKKIPSDFVFGITFSGDRKKMIDIFKQKQVSSTYVFISSIFPFENDADIIFFKIIGSSTKFDNPDFLARKSLLVCFDLIDIALSKNN